jgi:6-phosphofructokinase 1
MSDKTIERIGVLTSGGDAPGMNACLRAVVRACIYYNKVPYGIREGYHGLINNSLYKMDTKSVRHIIHRGGTILKSARCKDFKTKEGRRIAWENIKRNHLDALITIGGDGTFKGALALSDEYNMPVVGIPGTIDNDIKGTDYTIGFDTAINTVVEAVDKIRDTESSHNRLFFIEVMGRDAGDIALNAGIGAGAEEILIPEKDRGIDRLFKSLEKNASRRKRSHLVLVAEGETIQNVYELEKHVKQKFGDYYETKISVLGHIQRGGRPTCADRILASRLGVGAVEILDTGKQDIMLGMQDNKISYTPLKEATKQNSEIDEDLLHVASIVSV